jgi:hypothetical protein
LGESQSSKEEHAWLRIYRIKEKDADRDKGSCEERQLEKVPLERVQEGEWC